MYSVACCSWLLERCSVRQSAGATRGCTAISDHDVNARNSGVKAACVHGDIAIACGFGRSGRLGRIGRPSSGRANWASSEILGHGFTNICTAAPAAG